MVGYTDPTGLGIPRPARVFSSFIANAWHSANVSGQVYKTLPALGIPRLARRFCFWFSCLALRRCRFASGTGTFLETKPSFIVNARHSTNVSVGFTKPDRPLAYPDRRWVRSGLQNPSRPWHTPTGEHTYKTAPERFSKPSFIANTRHSANVSVGFTKPDQRVIIKWSTLATEHQRR
jgi:hypothetical protein